MLSLSASFLAYRTPLNCILGLSGLLQESDLTPTQEESVKMINSSGDLLLSVVNDVLDYSKLQSGNMGMHVDRCNLQEILDTVVYSLQVKDPSKGIQIVPHYDPALGPYIRTDSRRLTQILFNLLGNAQKFSRPNGVVELHVSVSKLSTYQALQQQQRHQENTKSFTPHRRLVAPNVSDEDRILSFVVKDYGNGIHESEYEDIFTPFRQAQMETVEALAGGTGLGLSIVAKLVNALDGEIRVSSKRGHFTEFSVAFPFGEPMANPDEIGAHFRNVSILLVGDGSNNNTNLEMGSLRQLTIAFDFYMINHVTLTGMMELTKVQLADGPALNKSSSHSFILMVQEDSFQGDVRKLFSDVASTSRPVMLVTFGPKYAVTESNLHFRSIDQILPSLLMERMAHALKIFLSGESVSKSQLNGSQKKGNDQVEYKDLRILVAEDNLINQKVLGRILQRLGATNFEMVDNGQKAVDREASEPFDIVLMDVQVRHALGALFLCMCCCSQLIFLRDALL